MDYGVVFASYLTPSRKKTPNKKTVQQNSLDLAKEAIAKLDAIEKELTQ